MWSDILANEIIRTRLNVLQFLDWSDILSDHFRKVIISSGVERERVGGGGEGGRGCGREGEGGDREEGWGRERERLRLN